MNPLAEELNEIVIQGNKYIYEMLSELGRNLYFPKGILSQSAEAKQAAYKYNATIGIATEGQKPMHLPCTYRYFIDLSPDEIFTYAPAAGVQRLREKWNEKLLKDNPSLHKKSYSTPIVTHALTHGLSIVADLFANPGDTLVLPDKLWGNYRMLFEVRKQVNIVSFPFYNKSGGFNIQGLHQTLEKLADVGKLIVLLNFPNNPTGYSLTTQEARDVVHHLQNIAELGCNVIAVLDDAYFGLFYEQETLKESLFGHLANLHPRLLAVKVDGATKEEFVWGFRVGFLTLGSANTPETVYNALERKIMGAIRGNISNCALPSQTLILKTLESSTFRKEQQEKFEILKQRALEVKRVLSNPKYNDTWTVYPFNSGYFMCLQLKTVEAEPLRQYLLKQYGVGIISINETDIRIAFSCLELDQIADLFDILYKAIKELEN